MNIKKTKTIVLAMALALASTTAVNAAEQRGGGGVHGGGGFHSGAGVHGGGGFHGRPAGHGFHGRHGFDSRGGHGFEHRHGFGRPRLFLGAGFYDPFYYPYGLFPFPYYPYAAYSSDLALDSNIKVKVTPKEAEVFVDGYYAGVSDNFDGTFQQLQVTPGGHVITIYLDGYRTLSRSIYAAVGSTTTFNGSLEPLAPGEVSAPPAPPASPQIPPVTRQTSPDDSDE